LPPRRPCPMSVQAWYSCQPVSVRTSRCMDVRLPVVGSKLAAEDDKISSAGAGSWESRESGMTALSTQHAELVRHTHDGPASGSHYVADFCRHPECKPAHAKYARDLRERKKSGDLADRRKKHGEPGTLTPLTTSHKRRGRVADAEAHQVSGSPGCAPEAFLGVIWRPRAPSADPAGQACSPQGQPGHPSCPEAHDRGLDARHKVRCRLSDHRRDRRSARLRLVAVVMQPFNSARHGQFPEMTRQSGATRDHRSLPGGRNRMAHG
jgi:hypothetical protein